MYTGVHLNVSQESYSFELFDLSFDLKIEILFEASVYLYSSIKHLIVGFRMLLCLRLCVFTKDKTFDCGNQNIH